MRRGLTLPIFDQLADPAVLASLATDAEAAGWNGVFVWDHVDYRKPVTRVTDPWISLAAIAAATSTVVFGPMVTPLARRRPQIVARQIVALDHLSSGRAVLGVGLGLDSSGGEFVRFGEEIDVARRAAMYDEALVLVHALLSGDPVDHDGAHFRIRETTFLPRPVQERLPIWVATRWPNLRPLDRAARHDGVFVVDLALGDLPPVLARLSERRAQGLEGFEVVVQSDGTDDPDAWHEAGATWWLAAFDQFSVTPTEVRRVIERLAPG
jgi:alkanesulfonate monooxygenase SsuD/methylene tetrahydromethanopterin reductase-like flavin-dependent oxidoreductase (luciferase family)